MRGYCPASWRMGQHWLWCNPEFSRGRPVTLSCLQVPVCGKSLFSASPCWWQANFKGSKSSEGRTWVLPFAQRDNLQFTQVKHVSHAPQVQICVLSRLSYFGHQCMLKQQMHWLWCKEHLGSKAWRYASGILEMDRCRCSYSSWPPCRCSRGVHGHTRQGYFQFGRLKAVKMVHTAYRKHIR